MVWTEEDEKFRSYVWRTRSNDFLVIGSFSSLTTEMRVLDANSPQDDFQVFAKRHAGHEYGIEHQGERWLVLTNDSDDDSGTHDERAVNRKLMEVPTGGNTERDAWTELVAHRDSVTLESVEAFERFIVVTERRGLEHLRHGSADRKRLRLEPPEAPTPSTAPAIPTTAPPPSIGYQSMITPRSIFDVDLVTGERTLKETPVLGGYDQAPTSPSVASHFTGRHFRPDVGVGEATRP